MVEFAAGKHKVLVTDEEGTAEYMFSQHDMLKFMEDNPSSIPEDLMVKTGDQLGYLMPNIVHAKTTAPVRYVEDWLDLHGFEFSYLVFSTYRLLRFSVL